jgi:hypothetical protein
MMIDRKNEWMETDRRARNEEDRWTDGPPETDVQFVSVSMIVPA